MTMVFQLGERRSSDYSGGGAPAAERTGGADEGREQGQCAGRIAAMHTRVMYGASRSRSVTRLHSGNSSSGAK